MTRLLMTSSALALAAAGLVATFAPQEVAAAFGAPPTVAILVQLLGALDLGFALLNWMSKESTIGGIYGRPLLMGNLVHFVAGGLALIKLHSSPAVVGAALVYAAFALAFGAVAFAWSPVKAD